MALRLLKLGGRSLAIALLLAGGALAQPPAPQEEEPAPTVSPLEVTATLSRQPITDAEQAAMSRTDLGVPQYSVEQMASFVCRSPTARGALDATEKFEAAKAAYRDGTGTLEAMVKADDVRQAAVRSVINMDFSGRKDLVRTTQGSLSITVADYRVAIVEGEQILVSTVIMTNHGERGATVPQFTIKALDRNARVLADVTFTSSRPVRLPAHSQTAFEVPYLNMPAYTSDVRAHFGPGSFPRNPRGCGAAASLHALDAPIVDMEGPEVAALHLAPARTAPLPPMADVHLTASRWVDLASGRALEIDATIVNATRSALPVPDITVIIIDADDMPVGQVHILSDGAAMEPNARHDITFQITEAEPLPAAEGRNPLNLMRRVSITVG